MNFFSKCSSGVDELTVCYEFDQRQCKGDDWAELVPMNNSKSEREARMKEYLESEGISVEAVKLVMNFHESVCESCFLCPEVDRFFVKIAVESTVDFEDFEFLNAGKVDCGSYF